MSEYVRVEQDSSLYKNTETGAVINVNDHIIQIIWRWSKGKVNKIEIDQLKDEISELKGVKDSLIIINSQENYWTCKMAVYSHNLIINQGADLLKISPLKMHPLMLPKVCWICCKCSIERLNSSTKVSFTSTVTSESGEMFVL